MAKEISSDSEVYGLVLIGGQSSRMGHDKAHLEYHGMPQSEYLFGLLSEQLSKVFYSVRSEDDEYQPQLPDQFETKGPINGILTAMKQYPDKAWLILACDLPLVTSETIAKLLEERDPSKLATAYAKSDSDLPEPLMAIWEPESQEALKQHHLIHEKGCPRKFLLNNEIHLIHPDDDRELFNANNQEEFEEAKQLIQ